MKQTDIRQQSPNLFLVGAPKCGTTSLFHWLSQHPDIFCGFRKEPHTLIGSPETQNAFSMPYSDYWAMYEDWDDEKYALDASTFYFASKSATRNINELSVNPKILIALRHPVEAIYSFYYESYSHGHERSKSFREALILDDSSSNVAGEYQSRYRYTYQYYEHVSRYLDVFGEDNVKIVFFDDIKGSPEQAFSGICAWLGIESRELDIHYSLRNAAKSPRSQAFGRLVLDPPRSLEKLASMFLSKRTRHGIRMFLREMNFRKRPNPPMSESDRKDLQLYYAPDIKRLARLLGRDLSAWTDSEP